MPFYEDVKEMPLGEVLDSILGVPVHIFSMISAHGRWQRPCLVRGARDVIQVVIDHNVGGGRHYHGHLLHAGSSSRGK
ncbi:hypothetical protein ACLK1T_26835 [Escherichia coli]